MTDMTDDDAGAFVAKLSEKPRTKVRREEVRMAQLHAEKDMEIADLLALLDRARPHVKASADAEHMLDGFGPRKMRPSDVLLTEIDAALGIPRS